MPPQKTAVPIVPSLRLLRTIRADSTGPPSVLAGSGGTLLVAHGSDIEVQPLAKRRSRVSRAAS